MYLLALFGAAIACYFLYAAFERPRPAVIVAVILWLLYAAWELAAARGALVDGVYCHPTTMCQMGYNFFFGSSGTRVGDFA